jgi:integrase/recombinase XerD
MVQASVLTESDVRRVFRIIETTRHADRNRLAFVLSIYGGMRVGEVAALTIKDIANQYGEARREIRLRSDQTKGSHGRIVVLSNRVRKEINAYLRLHPSPQPDRPLIRSQRGGSFFESDAVDAVQGNLRAGGDSEVVALRSSNICDAPKCQRCWNAHDSEANGP